MTRPLVLHVITDLTMGGAEATLLRLVEAHHGSGTLRHQIISLRGMGAVGARLGAAGARVDAMDLHGMTDLPRVIRSVVRVIRDRDPDILHCWMYHSNLIGGIGAKLSTRLPVIWGIRATTFDTSTGVANSTVWLRRFCARLSSILPDRIVYVSNSAREAHEAIGYDASRGSVIPNGFPAPRQVSKRQARTELRIPLNAVVVGSVGRFNAAKDPENFVRAAALLAEMCDDVLFLMVGRDISMANPSLAKWLSKPGLRDRFILLDEREDTRECMAALDLFCLHSATEAFPNVLAEAMSAGVACVTTDVGDAALMLGDAGLVVEPRNAKKLADAMAAMLEMSDEHRESMGRRGASRIAQYYSLTAMADSYARLYDELGGQVVDSHQHQRQGIG